MDIHKNFIQASVMDKQGNILDEKRFSSDPKEINEFIRNLNSDEIHAAIEFTCTWYHVYEKLDSLGVDTTLVNVRRTKVIAESKIKTDKLDARSLAHCLRTGFIATSYIPTPEIMELRDIMRHYISLGRELARHKNKIQAILLRNGVKQHRFTDLFGKTGLDWLRKLNIRESEKYRLDSYLTIVETLLNEKKRSKKNIETLCKHNRQAMLLTSIPGISYISAMIIITEIGDIKRFPSPKKLCSYAGLVPRTIQSGTHTYHGKILKECNTHLKWILNQCTHVHIRYCNSKITQHYCKLMNKKGKNKATIAASRKMLTCIWYMLTKGETFKYSD